MRIDPSLAVQLTAAVLELHQWSYEHLFQLQQIRLKDY